MNTQLAVVGGAQMQSHFSDTDEMVSWVEANRKTGQWLAVRPTSGSAIIQRAEFAWNRPELETLTAVGLFDELQEGLVWVGCNKRIPSRLLELGISDISFSPDPGLEVVTSFSDEAVPGAQRTHKGLSGGTPVSAIWLIS